MYSTKETSAGHAGSDKPVQTSLQSISKKAKGFKDYQFKNLYGMLNEENLMLSWRELNKKSAPGLDGETVAEYGQNLAKNINKTVELLKNKQYRAKLVKRTYIPKGGGKTRPLGLPAVSDKIVQRAAARVLEAIYEQDFSKHSYGYRKKVGAKNAVTDLTKELQFGRYGYIVEADIKGFFDNMDHDWLLKMLSYRVDDRAFLNLINKWLKAGVMDTTGKVLHPVTGTPQGGIISPILSNVYLHHALDLWFEKIVKPQSQGRAYISRYADDFVCAFQYKEDAERFYNALWKRLEKFKLELSPEKTKILKFTKFNKQASQSFDFLGFEFRWGTSRKGKHIIKRRTSRKKFKKSIQSFKEWCKENRNNRLQKVFAKLNAKLRGYYNYYGVIGNYESLTEFYRLAISILYKWLNRRSQRRSFNKEQFEKVIERYNLLMPRITEGRQISLDFIS